MADIASGDDAPMVVDDGDEVPTLVDLLRDQAQLRKLIDPDGLFTSKASKDYLERVSNLSLEALEQEPKIIHEEASFVSGELTSLCFREYRTFITVHQCAADVHTAFDSFTQSLDSLLDAVPSLEQECHAFAASTKQTQSDRRKASLLLEHHDKLLDLLEVPQLLDTCVRNGYYHEAMELGQHAQEMTARYGEVAIVRDVEREVEKGLMAMLVKLLGVLREQVKLPQLVKAVGFLRRMDVLSEDELQVAFLASREHNFRALLVAIERERADPVRYVRRYVDLFRENVYDVISQFTTIFLDHQKQQLLNQPPPLPNAPEATTAPSDPSSTSPPAPTLLITFAHQSLSALLTLLETHIPLIEDPSALSSLLTQLNYCATSFARVGLDFRSLVTEPFERAVVNSATKSMKEAEAGLDASLKGALRNGKMPLAWMIPPESVAFILDLDITSDTPFPSSSSTTSHTPPSYLTHFPDLSLLCNAHTNTLNSLRLLSPLSLFPSLLALQLQSLARSAALVLSYSQSATSDFAMSASGSGGGGGGGSGTGAGGRPGHRRNASVSAGPSDKDKKETKLVLRAFGRALVDGLVPFVRKGLVEGVFGGELGDLAAADERLGLSGGASKAGAGIAGLQEWVEKVEVELRPKKEEVEEVTVAKGAETSSPETDTGGATMSRQGSIIIPSALVEEPEEHTEAKGAEEDMDQVDEEIRELEAEKEVEEEREEVAPSSTPAAAAAEADEPARQVQEEEAKTNGST